MIFENRFQGRHAVVTGGAAGLGHGISRRIVAEGGSVEIWDINQEALDAVDLIGAKTRQIDVTDPCLLYTSPSPRDQRGSRMPSSA